MALQADKYLVWSDCMKEELKLYYPEIASNQIFITGTPQFECYQHSENIIPKEAFYTRYNLDLDKKIICYSGDDVLRELVRDYNDLICEYISRGGGRAFVHSRVFF